MGGPLKASFRYAWRGLKLALARERNLRIHFVLAAFALGLAAAFALSRLEWALVVLCIGMVVAAELFNAAVESLVDLCQGDYHPLAAAAKDMAAAGVLIAAAISLLVGGLVFIPRLWAIINSS
ncbi:MAG: diacylglycerol kinase family protein [Limnochordia bacterium]|nr:diacylglycerol kinase family protein [Bacillota bacterium]